MASELSRAAEAARKTVHFGPWVVSRSDLLGILFLAVLFVAGAFLRRYHLGIQSLWFDEADLVWRAGQDLSELIPGLLRAGENGPLYTLFLHFWMTLFGSSELIVRVPSFVLGSLSIPAIYYAGRKFGGPLMGSLAALLLTFSPYHIWYSQEAKMYAGVMLLTLLSFILFLEAVERPNKWLWAAFVIVTTLALYTHLASVLIIIAEAVMAVSLWRRSTYLRKPLALSFGLLVLPYLPIAAWEAQVMLSGSGMPNWYDSPGIIDMAGILLTKFSINRGPEPWLTIAAVLFGILALAGAAWAIWADRQQTGSGLRRKWIIIYLAVPVMILFAVTLRIPLFHDRYLLVVLPGFYLLSAGALSMIRGKLSIVPVLLCGVLLFTSYQALAGINYSSASQKEDWRGIVQYVQQRARLGDVVFILPGYMSSAFGYYWNSGGEPQYAALAATPAVKPENFDYRKMDTDLTDMARGKKRAWLVVSPERVDLDDPDGKIREWFDGNFRLFDVQVFNGARITGYSFNGPLAVWTPPPSNPTRVRFGSNLELAGFDLDTPTGRREVEQGHFLFVTLYWRAIEKMQTDYVVSAQIVSEDGTVVSQQDVGPLNGYYPTSKWVQGESVRDYKDLYIRFDVPPGRYRLLLAVYPPDHPEDKLPISGIEDESGLGVLGSVDVLPVPAE